MTSFYHFSPSSLVGGRHRFLPAILGGLLIALGTRAEAAILTVGPGKDFSIIGSAITDANPGDTIQIEPGTYDEQLTVDKNLTIQSDPATTTTANPVIVDGQNTGIVFTIISGVTVTIQGLVIQDGNGKGGVGGGVLNTGILTISDCLIRNNQSPSAAGGGLYHAGDSLTVTNCTFLGNTAGEGGGYYNAGRSPTLTNCTFVDNSATYGGAVISSASGATVSLINCTIDRNTATDGAAEAERGGLTALNSLIVENAPANCFVYLGTYTSNGHNLSTDGTCGGGTGDRINVTDVQAGPLLDNPGTTAGYIPPTYALHSHSPAVDAGDNSGAPSTDERGITRDSTVDIGAFEYNGSPADLTAAPTCGYTYDVGGGAVTDVKVTYQDTNTNDGIDTFNLTSDTNDAPTFQIGSGSANGIGVGIQVIPLDNRNDPLVLTSTKQDTGSGVSFTVNVEDFDGNHADCTAPIFTSIAIRQSTGYRRTFQNLTSEQGHLHLLNGDQGINQLEVLANGHDFLLAGLTPDQSADLDLTPAMQEGAANEVTLIGSGPVGSQAFALIGNGTIVRTDNLSPTGAGSSAPVPGDLNGDGRVDVRDVILLLEAVVGERTLTAQQLQAVGLSAGQSVTVTEGVALLRKVVGE